MDDARRNQPGVVIIGLVYAMIGIVFTWPASHVRIWRVRAWVLSAVVYASHIGYERFRMHSAPHRAALHVASAVAVGGLGIAISALVHSLSVIEAERHTRLLLIALVAWPILTGVPAFVVALGASEVLLHLPFKASPR